MSSVPLPLRRWAGTLAMALLLSAGCVGAGIWQWNRHVARSEAVAVVQTNYDAAPLPVAEVLGPPGQPLPTDAVWRPVRATGHYLADAHVLLRNRPVGGQPGFHVLVPFAITEGDLRGTVLVVDRGWVPTGEDSSSAASVPDPPDGSIELVVRLRSDERPANHAAPEGQVHAIAVEQVRTAAGTEDWPSGSTLGAYGAALSEDGERAAGLGALASPTTSLGSHLSYAFQWWVFALGVLVGAVVLLVRESRNDLDDLDDTAPDPVGAGTSDSARTPRQPDRTRRRRPTAEEEEDALIDAQLR